MKNTTRIGDISVAAIIAALAQADVAVSVPFGHGHRYDLVVDVDDRLFRVQCKTGRLEKGYIEFNTYSVNIHNDGMLESRAYRGQIEYFGVYCPANCGCYLIRADEIGLHNGHLRVEPARNGQEKRIRWAADYELSKVVAGLRRIDVTQPSS